MQRRRPREAAITCGGRAAATAKADEKILEKGNPWTAWIRAATESALAHTPPHEEDDNGPGRYIPVAYFLSTR